MFLNYIKEMKYEYCQKHIWTNIVQYHNNRKFKFSYLVSNKKAIVSLEIDVNEELKKTSTK